MLALGVFLSDFLGLPDVPLAAACGLQNLEGKARGLWWLIGGRVCGVVVLVHVDSSEHISSNVRFLVEQFPDLWSRRVN